MKKRNILMCLVIGSVLLGNTGISSKDNPANAEAITSGKDSAIVRGEPCDIKLRGIHFIKSVNGAANLVDINKEKIEFNAGEKTDYFIDPDGKLSNSNAPLLLAKVDNTKPFTLTAKVTPGFTKTGQYNAGALYIYVNDNFWQKFAFEQDERGNHRIVTVRTIGTSDDNNHDVVNNSFVYMKISSDTHTVGSYYSVDNKNWQLVRLYKNNYPEEIWLGISTQCPIEKGIKSNFENINLEQKSISDFRMGN